MRLHRPSSFRHDVGGPVRLRAVAGGLLLSLLAGSAWGSNASSPLTVSVTLHQPVSFHVAPTPGTVQVTEADVARGYVDVATPVEIVAESAALPGFGIVLTRTGDAFRGARVHGPGGDAQLTSVLALTWQPRGRREILRMHFRLLLAPQLPPGRYAWPVQVTLDVN
jgi:hypothetical protein